MSNVYPELLETCVEAVDSPQGLIPATIAEQIFETMVRGEASIADPEAFCRCELGHFAERGLHEKVRKDLRNFEPPAREQLHLFPDLDLRYTVPYADGGERQIEHAYMTRDEWLMAEAHLRTKAAETARKADLLEQCRLTFDRVWRTCPQLTSQEAFRLAFAQGSAEPAVVMPVIGHPAANREPV